MFTKGEIKTIMAKKSKTVFVCQECGYESPKWMGQCPACRQWNTFVEETVSPQTGKSGTAGNIHTPAAEPVSLSQVEITAEERLHTGIRELTGCWEAGLWEVL